MNTQALFTEHGFIPLLVKKKYFFTAQLDFKSHFKHVRQSERRS